MPNIQNLTQKMNLNKLWPKNETEGLLLSITLIKQTPTKPQETLEFKLIKPRETFHFIIPISIEGDLMIGLLSLEVYTFVFNILEKINKFKLYKCPDERKGGVSFEKVRDEIERNLEVSDVTASDLHNDIKSPNFTEEYREEVSLRMKNGEYIRILALYNSSIFQDFESFLRKGIDLVEDDIRLVLDEYNWSFITYEIEPGVYTLKDLSKLFLKFFNLNMIYLTTQLILLLMKLPWKLNWL